VFADETRSLYAAGGVPWSAMRNWWPLALAQAAIGISSDRQFLGLIGRVLPG
jgi:hypothetical protein